jgi:hypothetical protein
MILSDRARTARLVAHILASRPTLQDELPSLIEKVHAALHLLSASEQPTKAAPEFGAEAPAAVERPRRRRRAAAVQPPAEEPAGPPPTPTLVRRSDVASAVIPALVAATPGRSTARGIVKWYDVRHRRGALRLPGFSGDVPVEAAMLAQAGIARLYKGQEVEATLDPSTEPPRLMRLALPGGTLPRLTTSGVVRGRQAKPVVVELKTDSLRRVAARAEAEQLLRPARPR